uniref:Auxin response factor n=1 Tax=Cyrtomium guizhouense TaxID=306076 RepID=A0A1X9T690_9MONI|nr:auxin response factor 2 [Cyrtomium guizhouense]
MAFFRPPRPGFNYLNASSPYPSDSSVGEIAQLPGAALPPQSMSNPGDYTEELWQACAGPLVSVPKIGERVWYFPQGHMEQVAASTGQHQGTGQQMPQYNLPSQIMCRVMNRSLSAEADTDEVFAQLALLPETAELSADPEESTDPPPARTVRLFTKILTASDTSTHGGFSVLRKHAEDCLPSLDMSQENPSQELTATDLHGQEWKFRHTYRGHPRRHLLTTGWSYFVSQKKLVAGDAVVFLRGENGELRVGIRRTKRQQTSQSSNVLTSHCMHMGVIATAAHAVTTRTLFSVFYKPRASSSSFVVPVEKLTASVSNKLSVGMRFKMKFEGEDATERSYAGTITGIEDLNAACWPNSKWRSLRVNWDEMTNHEQRERISPWEIELCVHSQAPANLSPAPKSKRLRAASTLDLGSRASLESSLSSISSKPSGSLPGHELQAGGSGVLSVGGVLRNHQHVYGKQYEQQLDYGTPAAEGFNMLQSQVAPLQARWLVAGNVDPCQHQHSLYPDHLQQQQGVDNADPCLRQQSLRSDQLQQQTGREETYSFFPLSCITSNAEGEQFSDPVSSQIHNAANANMQFVPGSWQPSPRSTFMPVLTSENSSSRPFIPLVPTSSNAMLQSGLDKPQLLAQHQTLGYSSLSPFAPWEYLKQDKPVDTGCKLFGFSLTQPSKLTKQGPGLVEEHVEGKGDASSQAPPHTHENELPQQSHMPEKSVSSEPEISDNTCFKVSKDGDSRSLSNPPTIRSCTKVIKKGSMVGRGVDLSKFDGYKKLIEELEGMFHIEGELSDPDKGWQVAYSDDEGDMMHVGDDPWMEFCRMVRKIYIFSPEEVRTTGLLQGRTHSTRDEFVACRDVGKACDPRDASVPALPG